MTNMDLSRHARQVVLPEVGVNGQQLLADSTVLVVGCGGLGAAAIPYLAGAGVGRLLLADRDRVERSNLQRQVIYDEADIGQPKAEAAAAAVRALDAQLEVTALQGRLTPEALAAAVAEADVVLDCTDNFPTRFAINAACVAARKPLVSGAAIRFEGQLAVFDLRHGGPCYACLFSEQGADGERCEEAGVLGPVVGTIGSLQALAALKLLLGLPAGSGELQNWDALAGRWRRLGIVADPDCRICHGR
jgi:Dinucleotide-utilizing enzymes involved in molybdopterin and thiamine biosynthesis family 2